MASRVSMCLCRGLTLACKKTPVLHFRQNLYSQVNNVTSHIFSVGRFCKKEFGLGLNFSRYTNPTCVASRQDDIKGLADTILKAKIEEDSKQSSDSRQSSTSDEKNKKSEDFSKKAMKYTFIAFGSIFTGVAGFLIYEWGSPRRDENGNVIQDEFTDMPFWKSYILRTYKEIMYYDKMIKDPSREKLLPEPLTDPYYQPPFTLVLEMTGILVHPDWTYQTGWRFKKRPGVDYFLQQVGPPLFEVVIFTSEQGFTALPIIDSLDPHGYVMYKLFRDATRYMGGHHIKDLSCLNRDLSKVIFVDWNDKSFQLQSENALKLKKWTGNDDDKILYDLANFLRTIASSGVEDVRPVLQHYSQFSDPLEVFKEKQRQLQEEQEQKLQEEKSKSNLIKGWRGGFFGKR